MAKALVQPCEAFCDVYGVSSYESCFHLSFMVSPSSFNGNGMDILHLSRKKAKNVEKIVYPFAFHREFVFLT